MKKLLALLLALVMVLSLTACSGSGNEEPAQTEAKTEEAAKTDTAVETLKIGVVTHQTGANVVLGNRQIYACELAKETINANGGVNGAQLEIVYFDCGDTQQDCINAVQLACNTEGISGIVNSFFSQNCIACSDTVAAAKIPTINLGNSSALQQVCTENPYYWNLRLTDAIANGSTVDAAVAGGITYPAIIYMTNSSGQTQNAAILKRYEELGHEICADIAFDNTATIDYQSLVTQAMNSGSDGIILIVNAEEAPGFISLLKQQNYQNPIAISPAGFSADVVDVIGDQVDGVFGACEFNADSEREQTKNYVTAYAEQTGGEMTAAWQDAVTYDSISLLCEAAKLSGSNDAESINAGLAKIQNFEGALCALNYHEDKTFASQMYNCAYVGSKIVCGDPFDPRA